MLVDARTIHSGKTFSAAVCIVGSGAAGITLARQLASTGTRVCLVEGGGLTPDEASMSLYAGENVGRAYGMLEHARLRYFGGTTGHWAGYCRALEADDFEPHSWIPHSGWPLRKSELDPFYARAHEICDLGPYNYDSEYWARQSGTEPFAFDGSRFFHRITQFSPPVRFGLRYRKKIKRDRKIVALHHANLVRIETDQARNTVRRVHLATLSGVRFTVQARHYVLACGGIENPRLLLLANLGNAHDLVGRYFMEHTNLHCARVVLGPEAAGLAGFYGQVEAGATAIQGGLGLRPELREQEKLANVSGWLESLPQHLGTGPPQQPEESIAESRASIQLAHHVGNVLRDRATLASVLAEGEKGERPFTIRTVSEQVPNPESRVTLSDEKDALGLNRVRLDWRLTRLDKRSIHRTVRLIGLELGRLGLGRVRMELSESDDVWPEPTMWGHHHMGTTRMHEDPRKGVVDAHSRVHGVDNLHVAGSSVFPTGGSAGPTLTIVALALRLADRLQAELRA